MKKRLFDFFRMIIASPELLAAMVVLFLLQLIPQLPEVLLAMVDIGDRSIKISILGVPIIMTLGCYKICSEILNPSEHKAHLYTWPDFWLLRNRILMTLGISVLSCLISSIGVGLITIGEKHLGVPVIAASLTALVVSIIHAVLAKIALTEILNTPPENL